VTAEPAAAPAAAPLQPDPAIVRGLQEMGFAPEVCRRAALACNNASLETAMECALAEG
jgi:uncharacterized UBP type Zn finger protein